MVRSWLKPVLFCYCKHSVSEFGTVHYCYFIITCSFWLYFYKAALLRFLFLGFVFEVLSSWNLETHNMSFSSLTARTSSTEKICWQKCILIQKYFEHICQGCCINKLFYCAIIITLYWAIFYYAFLLTVRVKCECCKLYFSLFNSRFLVWYNTCSV